jgi:ribonuclease HI
MLRSMERRRMLVFTDGASKGNPGPGGWGVVILTPDGHVTELGGGSPHTTNNQMELTAVIQALKHLQHTAGTIDVYCDSTYVIRGISQWIAAWKKRGWKTTEGKDVLNRASWEALAHLVSRRKAGSEISWHYVRGHTRVAGNERADTIAVQHAAGRRVDLYDGALQDYRVPLHDIPADTSLPERGPDRRRSAGKKQAAYSYVSVVNGRPMRHATWPECERRVKGQSGARFKKALSAADEAAILKGWGFSADDLCFGC